MKRVYVNEEWCLGCHLCEYYCAFAGSGEKDMARALREIKISPRIRVEEHNGISFAVNCRHCREPLCVKSCITGALTITDNAVISIDGERCVECCTCILSCPFGAISRTPNGGGAIQKCELCVKTESGIPACVQGCPNGAIVFEDAVGRTVV
ncbi:MAG: 4Fe-4S binding protein [Oscillospiraceae bacterium]|nr:4Fe-4S binding protein [Oscillospiraceae bacterium]